MPLKLEKIFPEKCYLLRSKDTFLFRFCNGAFGSKWAGVWNLGKKFIEYFAFQVNGEWLDFKNVVNFEYGWDWAVHEYKLNSLPIKVKEIIRCLGNGIEIELQTGEEVDISLEIGVNIRKFDENEHKRKYWTKVGKNKLEIGSKLGSLEISCNKNFEFEKWDLYRKHFPGKYVQYLGWKWYFEDTVQDVYNPGILKVKGRE